MRRLPTVRLAIIMTNSEASWLIEARMAYTTNPTNTIVSSIWNTRQRTERYLEVTERILTRDSGWKLNSKSNAEAEKSHAETASCLVKVIRQLSAASLLKNEIGHTKRSTAGGRAMKLSLGATGRKE